MARCEILQTSVFDLGKLGRDRVARFFSARIFVFLLASLLCPRDGMTCAVDLFEGPGHLFEDPLILLIALNEEARLFLDFVSYC